MKTAGFVWLVFFADLPLAFSFGASRLPPTTTRTRGATGRVAAGRGKLQTTLLSSSQRDGGEDADDDDGATPDIDRQSDDKYGRGLFHISADLSEGDVVAYQDGTWYIDGSEVGDGSDATVKYMRVDTIQLVWTHDCEHGVINGFDLEVAANDDDDAGLTSTEELGPIVGRGSRFVANDEYVQVGPEQVLARIPTASSEQKFGDDERVMFLSRVDFFPDKEIMTS